VAPRWSIRERACITSGILCPGKHHEPPARLILGRLECRVLARGVPVDDRSDSKVLESLVRKAQGGDARAFDDLASRCRGRVYRWALMATGDPDDAEDVTQEVLVSLQSGLKGFEARSRLTSWLYRVTRNAATSLHRHRGARARAADAVGRESDPALDPGDWVDDMGASGLVELVKTFFRELPLRQREVFDLVDLQGLSQGEAAEMLEMNATTLRVHLFRARRTIRASILATHPALVEDRHA
jgi:RNA polymerase sigma-70 factor (ECF subfamily)